MSRSEPSETSPLLDKSDDPETAAATVAAAATGESDNSDSQCLPRCLQQRQPSTLAWVKSLLGYTLVIFAGLTFTAANVIQKIVAPELNFWHILFYRAVVQMVIMGVFIACSRTEIMGPRESRARIFSQGCLGGLLLLCIFVAIKNVPLGNASAIFFCTPVFTFFFAMFMLNENMGLYRSMISCLMVVGVILITRPPFFFGHDVIIPPDNCTSNSTDFAFACVEEAAAAKGDFSTTGYLCAILVPLLSAVVSILTRQLKHIHAPVLMFWFAAGSFVVASGGLVFTQATDLFDMDGTDWACTFAIIFFGLVGNASYTLAVRWVSPSKANVWRSFEVILNFLLQLALEHSQFHLSNVFGIAFLLLAVLSTGFETEVMKRFGTRFSFL